ncbi:hypothetical protein NSK11_contig00088-0014 [Nocardia seriolae]|uniref:DUF418 domain-containing protein n=2 Tax=Nocardia seriolae TaxID=37332 RepID=A0ABC9Z042_9NOCA|nr:DUF418 domain-containing protein [Nocardia seriolae]GAM48655.1 hypothetical protein NS07_v2contig00082-0014 [Nocardia seriolae]GAP30608.1 hypothetical protein NSK11_contig00088-0014 [Nocardia seriolae]
MTVMVESASVQHPAHSASQVADYPNSVPAQPASARLAALDVLRGIAILGTLGTNVWIFTNTEGLLGYISRGDEPHGAWLWIERFLQQLAQGKCLGLLTIMFGIGLAIQQRSAVRGGRAWPGGYPVRAGLLLLDGLVNFFFVAEFDVLMGYALTRLVVAIILATSPKAQRRWLIVAAGIHLAMLSLIVLAIAFGPSGDSGGRTTLDPNPYADGSFWDLVVFRWEHVLLFRLEPIFIFPMSIALFLLGARLFRAGIFQPEGARIRKRLMVIGFAVGAPIDLLLGMFGGDLILPARYGTAPLVSLGLLALVAEIYAHRPGPGWVGRRLGEVGRMALSCYILQNLVAGFLCYGWGLGLAGLVSADARVPFTAGIYVLVCALMLRFAHCWLRRFERGPVEWLWNRSCRALTGR